MQLGVGNNPVVLAFLIRLPDDGRLATALFQVPVDAVGRRVERAVIEPADMHVITGKGDVLDARKRLHPVETLRLFRPEGLRILNGTLVHGLVGVPVDQRLVPEVVRDRVDRFVTHHCLLKIIVRWSIRGLQQEGIVPDSVGKGADAGY